MSYIRLPILPLLAAAALLFTTASLYPTGVATASQQEKSAHSRKPAQFHYVCPMHEDVTSKTRGKKCPKCKMKLERRRIKEPAETQAQ